VAGRQLPPKFWVVGKLLEKSSCPKISIQKYKIWSWKHPLEKNLKAKSKLCAQITPMLEICSGLSEKCNFLPAYFYKPQLCCCIPTDTTSLTWAASSWTNTQNTKRHSHKFVEEYNWNTPIIHQDQLRPVRILRFQRQSPS